MRIPKELSESVAFVYCKRNSGMEVRGTAFFIGYPLIPDRIDGPVASYIVTSRHVIDRIREISSDATAYIRLNRKEVGTEFISLPLTSWRLPESRVDLAVSPVEFDYEKFRHSSWPTPGFLDAEMIETLAIGPGDELFFPGLFSHHPGENANVPIIRTGSIAAMPGERIFTDSRGYIRAYLVEARSIGGLSGSPVFVNLDQIRPMPAGIGMRMGSMGIRLLGVVQGHYGVRDLPDDLSGEGDSTTPAEGRSVNVGIAIVVPIDELSEFLEQPEFVEHRSKELKRWKDYFQQYAPVDD